jgi:hypothetical protein
MIPPCKKKKRKDKTCVLQCSSEVFLSPYAVASRFKATCCHHIFCIRQEQLELELAGEMDGCSSLGE